jgi:hypothetical protein
MAHRLVRYFAPLAACAVLAATLVPNALADSESQVVEAPATAQGTEPEPEPDLSDADVDVVDGSGAEPAVSGEAAAVQAAAQLGEPVEILDQTSEYERRLANPDGSVTFQMHAVAQRVNQGGSWVPIDTTLQAQGDQVVPAATSINVSLSNGGSRSLVTLAEGDATLELSWTGPEPLPTPTLSQDTATYSEVLPDVDLLVRIDGETIAMVLKVKSREAAQHEFLDRLSWDVSVEGGSLEVGGDGSIGLVPAGESEPVLWAPPSTMWDSPENAESESLRTLNEVGQAADSDSNRVETMDVELDGNELTVLPDQEMLADEDTIFPVYIDPPFGIAHQNWAPVYKSKPNNKYSSGTSWPRDNDLMRVGLNTWAGCGSGCGVWRSHVRFTISNISGENYRLVNNPTFGVFLVHSGDCAATPVELWRTSSIGSGASWNDMKSKWLTNFGTKSGKANKVTCGQDPVEMTWSTSTMKSKLQSAMNSGNATFTFGLKAKNEGDRGQWKKFYAESAKLEGTINSVPDKPTAVKAQSGCAGSCASGATLRITRPTFQAKVANDFGGKVTAKFELRTSGGSLISTKNQTVDSGTVATWKSGSLTDGKSYKVRVRAKNDDGVWGAWSSYYNLSIDTSGPSKPSGLGVTGGCYGSCDSPAILRTLRPEFKANVGHPFGDNLKVSFEVRNSSKSSVVKSGTVNPATAGTTVTWRPPSDLTQERKYHVRVRTEDEYGRSSSWSSYYTFNVDTEAPPPPDVSSSLYLHKDTGTWNGGIGVAGKFTFNPNGAADVVKFQWRFNGGTVKTKNVSKGTSYSPMLTPESDLDQMLEVRSIDHAGNTSTWTKYQFYVRPQPESAGYWKFDEGSGTKAHSSIGEATGTRYGGSSWISSDINGSVAGNSGYAAHLDGSNDFVRMPPALTTNHAAGYTVSAWVKLDDLDGFQYPVSINGDNTSIFAMYYHPDSDKWCLRANGADNPSSDVRKWACSDIQAQAGKWTHLVGVYDKPAGKIRLWVNGGPNNGQATPGSLTEVDAPAAWRATGSIEVGRGYGSSFGGYVDGQIDEVRAHQRVLIESEVVHIYQSCSEAPQPGRTQSCPVVPEPDDAIQVGAWNFEETSGDQTADDSGIAGPAILHGEAGWTAFGHNGSRANVSAPGRCGYFAPEDNPVLTEESFTVAAWVRMDSTDGDTVIRFPGPGPATENFSPSTSKLKTSNGSWQFFVYDSGFPNSSYYVASGGVVEPGEWTHLVGTYDAGAQQLRLYVDGQLVDSVGGAVSQESWGIQLGGERPAGFLPGPDCQHPLGGTLDTVSVYQGAVSGTQVSEWYNEQKQGPVETPAEAVASWPMQQDPFEPDVVREATWSGNDGVLTGGATWSDPAAALEGTYGVEFDGASGAIPMQWSPIDTSKSFSVSAWIRPEAQGIGRTAITVDGLNAGQFEIYTNWMDIYPPSPPKVCFRMSHSDVIESDKSSVCRSVTVGRWSHVLAVFDKPARELRLYVNGDLFGSKAVYDGLEPWNADGPLVLGRDFAGLSGRWWDGGIAQVRAYQGVMPGGVGTPANPLPPNHVPTAAIDTPSDESTWAAGEEITFSGHAGDLDGDIVAADLSWTLRMRDCEHPEEPDCVIEDLETWTGIESGSFVAPDVAEPQYLELTLTASTEHGTHNVSTDLSPRLADVTFESTPADLELTVCDDSAAGPFTMSLVEGSTVAIDATSPQVLDDVEYVFDGWAHGGAASQTITVPEGGETYTATYQESDLTPVAVINSPSSDLDWVAGDEIDFSGEAANTDGPLSDAQLSWQLIAEYCLAVDDCYLDVLETWDGVASGSFTAPDLPYAETSLTLELTAEADETHIDVTSVELLPAQGGPVSDDFSAGVLDEGLWTVTDQPGVGDISFAGVGTDDVRLVLDVPAGERYDPYDETGALSVKQSVANESFEVVTAFTAAPAEDSQGQGILVEQDADNWLTFDTYRNYLGEVRVFIGGTANGETADLLYHTAEGSPDHLRMTRIADDWAFAISEDGGDWTEIGAVSFALDVAAIGPMSYSSGPLLGNTTEVDYFFNTASPIDPEDG